MHDIQRKILKLSGEQDLRSMTLRDISEAIGEGRGTPQKIKHHLQQLTKKGLLISERGGYRRATDMISKDRPGLLSLPILGSANCGEAISFADDCLEGYLKVSPSIVKNEKSVFIVRAKGNSMNKAAIGGEKIDDGDYVLVDSSQKTPQNGDYILSIIDGLANIKRFKKDPERKIITLTSESTSAYAPIYIHQDDHDFYSVAGKVVGVLKN